MEPRFTLLIADEEPNNLTILRSMLQRHVPQATRILEASSVAEALGLVLEHHPYILLLDVQIHQQNGFELLQQMPDYRYEAIFITIYPSIFEKLTGPLTR